MIKILHILDKLSVDGSQIHGPARQLLYRLPYYPRHLYEARICNLRFEDQAADLLRSVGISVTSLNKSKFDPTAIIDLIRLVKSYRPNVLHLHGYASWTFGRIVAKLFHIPVVLQEHFIDAGIPSYQMACDWALRNHYCRAIAISEPVKQFMINKRFLKDRVDIISNSVPVDGIKLPTAQDSQTLKEKLNISASDKVVGILGRLAKEKGHIDFLKAAEVLSNKISKIKFIIVGDGPSKNQLQRFAANSSVSDKVIFTGYQPDPFLYLSIFDVTVIASYSEGFCSVGIESFLVDTPIVCSDLPSFKGLYDDQVNCLQFPAGDILSMANAIYELLLDRFLVSKLMKNARKTIDNHHTSSIAGQYLRIYDQVVLSWS